MAFVLTLLHMKNTTRGNKMGNGVRSPSFHGSRPNTLLIVGHLTLSSGSQLSLLILYIYSAEKFGTHYFALLQDYPSDVRLEQTMFETNASLLLYRLSYL